jgi:hypothetical protein
MLRGDCLNLSQKVLKLDLTISKPTPLVYDLETQMYHQKPWVSADGYGLRLELWLQGAAQMLHKNRNGLLFHLQSRKPFQPQPTKAQASIHGKYVGHPHLYVFYTVLSIFCLFCKLGSLQWNTWRKWFQCLYFLCNVIYLQWSQWLAESEVAVWMPRAQGQVWNDTDWSPQFAHLWDQTAGVVFLEEDKVFKTKVTIRANPATPAFLPYGSDGEGEPLLNFWGTSSSTSLRLGFFPFTWNFVITGFQTEYHVWEAGLFKWRFWN